MSPASITRKLEMSNSGYHSTGAPGISNLGESSDDYYGVASDTDIVMHERYKNDAKLRKRCAVVITPTKELIQFERKRNEMYNEILQKQRRKLELRALEKQREKERRRPGRRKEQKEQTKVNSKDTSTATQNERIMPCRRMTSYHEHFMSSESECETVFQVRTRKQMPQNGQELEPLNIRIEAAEDTTTTLLSQIDAHLDKPLSEQTCDISIDESQTKMEKLNLLADVAHNLSPYQLDLPDQNNPPISPLHAPVLSQFPELAPESSKYKDVPREKVIVTEQIFIQSIDNLSEKRELQLDNKDQQQNASSSYAHEPKLNIAANFESSPHANLVQNENKENNTKLENSDYQREEPNPEPQTDETFEHIVKESVSILNITSPYNPLSDCAAIRQHVRSDSKIPILISNVESLNAVEQNDAVTQKSVEKVHLLHNATKTVSENFILTENQINKTVETKDLVEEDNIINTAVNVISSNILGNAESSVISSNDLTSTPNEKEISHNLNAPPLITADLSDISLESEISKHLPEIAEPSPVVTDMSDYSNESVVSKSFSFRISNINNTITNPSYNNEMPLTDLPLVMPNITEQTKVSTSQQNSLEPNFNEFNSTLNTPTKLGVGIQREEGPATRLTSDLNTPVKYTGQPQLETKSIPLNNDLETETDNNVTTFLDLILNKTVTDAESETRDKIIKELSALTADPGAIADIHGSKSNNDIMPQESVLNEDEKMNSSDPEITIEANKCPEKKILKEMAVDLRQQSSLATDSSKSDETSENSLSSHSLAPKISEPKAALKDHISSETESESIELNPPKTNLPDHKELMCDNKDTELNRISILPSDISSSPTKMKTEAVKQIFNIRCRVRLKRFNVVSHGKITNNESSPTIITTKSEELLSSDVDTTKCDTVTEKPLPIKKPSSKSNNKHTSKDPQDKVSENYIDVVPAADVTPIKKPKLESEMSIPLEAATTPVSQKTQPQIFSQASQASVPLVNNTTSVKAKTKTLKTVTFDLSNLSEELRDNTSSSHKQKSKNHAAGIAAGASGFYMKSSRPSRKLPDNTLRAAETLQLFVNTINASTRTPPAEFNKKRSPIKNKCIAEDETPRPPPASTLMGTPPCKKSCIEKSRSHLPSSKCKDQLVSSLTTPSISNINSDIATARIYTSSPLDQTLPEYDDNVDTVADTELILPTTSGSLRRKLKRPKKSLSKPQPIDDVVTDDISNQPDCNGEDDTDAVADNEDDVFAEELLPIPAANEHILEEIVSARQTHIGTGTVIRDDYMNIEATATVPVYLFNDESRDLGSPEAIQSSDNTNVVDSSSYLNTSSATVPSNVMATPASTPSAAANLEKSMLSPSEHEVSSTQETFYQTPTKNKQAEIFVEKSSTSKDKGNISMGLTNSSILKQKPEDKILKNKEDYQFSSTVGLLQNNQVDTTNHSPEMCTLTLTATTTTTPTLTSNRKIRKASTHDEILFNELQQQLPPTKRKSNNATFCVESTSDNNSKTKILANSLEDVKSNGSLAKADDQFKKLLKEVCKIDKNQINKVVDIAQSCGGNNSGGGSSPSTTTTINEETLSKSKRKKLKSSKSKKRKNQSERSLKTVLKASKLSPNIPAKPLIITIPKSRLLRPPSTPTPPTLLDPQDDQLHSEFLDIPNAKLFMEKRKETMTTSQNRDYYSLTKTQLMHASTVVSIKSNSSQGFGNTSNESTKIVEPNIQVISQDSNSAKNTFMPKDKTLTTRKKEKLKTTNDTSSTSTSNYTNSKTCTNSNKNNLIFVKDKYDLIKSKDKYHNQPQQDDKEKSKEKTNSLSKSVTSNSSRLHKTPAKEKVKGDKIKEKTKTNEKPSTEKQQADNVLKLIINQNQSKSLSSSASLPLPASYASGNTKQSNTKSNKTNSSSSPLSSSASLSTSAIHKSKKNSSTQLSDETSPSHATTATLSTNNK